MMTQQQPNPFANGKGAGTPRADATWLGGDVWRVFLYPENRPIRCYDVEAPDSQEAIRHAWARYKEASP